MTNKKYKLNKTDKTTFGGKPLFQVEALISFGSISKGDKGGYIEKEANLDVSGNAWVSGNARVSGDAWVSGNARVSGDAWVYGNAQVSGDAQVYGDARVYGDAQVSAKIDLTVNCELNFPRMKIDTADKLKEVISFMKKYEVF